MHCRWTSTGSAISHRRPERPPMLPRPRPSSTARSGCGAASRSHRLTHRGSTTCAMPLKRHADLLGELVMAAQAYPLDERLAGQLMLAQYRCGRQAGALETYRLMRERLVEELGVDPSPTLREVHQRILDGDKGAPHPKGPEPSRDRSAVIALPRRATSFVGRTQELSRLADALHQGPMLTLIGVGGVGKTRLGLEVAGRERERVPDGVWLCELAPLDDGAAVGHAVAAALRLQQRQGLDIEATVIEYLATRELL